MVKISVIKYGKLPRIYHAVDGCTFTLTIDNKKVHSEEITEARIITCWALLRIEPGGIAYAVGDDTFYAELARNSA